MNEVVPMLSWIAKRLHASRRAASRIVLGLAGGLALSLVVIVWRAVDSATYAAPTSLETSETSLTCAEAVRDYGEIEDPSLRHVFELVNASTNTIEIERIGKTCGCLVPRLGTKTLQPGAKTTLKVEAEVNPARAGAITRFDHQLLVHSRVQGEESAAEPLILSLRGTYIPPLYYLTTQVGIDAPELVGESFETRLPIFLNKARGVRIEKLTCRGPLEFDAAVTGRRMVDDGAFERVEIRISGALTKDALPRFGTLEVLTNNLAVRKIEMPIALRAKPGERVSFQPDRVAFGVLNEGETAARDLDVTAAIEEGWRFYGATASDPGIRVEVLHGETDVPSTSSQTIRLRCTVGPVERGGSIEAQLTVVFAKADSRRRFSVAISGFVKAGPPPRSPRPQE